MSPRVRGKGYGKQMLKRGFEYAFNVYKAREVSLGVFANNPSAYHCYKSVGLEENGTVEEYSINGYKWKRIEMHLCLK